MATQSGSNKITVKIELFPPFAKTTSKEQITLDLKENATVKDLIQNMAGKDDHFGKYLGEVYEEEDIRLRVLIIHNDSIARLNNIVRQGDSFKFLHPLQGG